MRSIANDLDPTSDVGVVVRAEHACFTGTQGFYEHESRVVGGPMRFGLFVPGAATPTTPAPLLVCLAGLTCNEETFAIKAGAQRTADALGVALLTPDTSPRHARCDGDDDAWDFGIGAGFYVDATQAPWSKAYRMRSYLLDELLPLVGTLATIDGSRVSITGHSMGGHGALTLALSAPERFCSVSAFAPICAPSQVPWGQKAFGSYLGDDVDAWRDHDACALLQRGARFPGPAPLVDQGDADKFLVEQLRPELLGQAAAQAGQELLLRRHAGFDHGYFFVQSFVEEHVRFHGRALGR